MSESFNSENVKLRSWVSIDEVTGHHDWAAEFAIDVIVASGMAPDGDNSLDALGNEVGDQLQSLLMQLALRAPAIADQLRIHGQGESYFSEAVRKSFSRIGE